jgi:Big-like domain-containing protein
VVSQSTETTDGVVLSTTYIVDNNLADIMSLSFGACEQNLGSLNSLFSALYQQAAAEGISVFVSTGDTGAASCDATTYGPAAGGLAVNGLASTGFDTAVGGTEFVEGSDASTYWGTNGAGQTSVAGYIPEEVWNESCDPTKTTCFVDLYSLSAGGGGVSTIYSKPSWQSAGVAGMPSDNQRDLPDVSLTAAGHDDYLFCVALFAPCSIGTGGSQTQLLDAGSVAGTSASVQAFAGFMALVVGSQGASGQSGGQSQNGRQGLANYALYKLAAAETFTNCNASSRTNPAQPAPNGCIFNDITQSNNGVPGNDVLTGPVASGDGDGQLGYNALSGYDSASGLGSVNAANLVSAWNSVTFRGSTTTLASAGSTTVEHGKPISFSVNVAALAGSGTPSGPFVLIAQNAPAAFNGRSVASGMLSQGMFSGSFSSLPGGQYQVVARYQGDATFGASESGPVLVNVSPENSSVSLSGEDEYQNPFTAPASINLGYGLGQPLQITVSSASGNGTPTGTVALLDGSQQIAELPLNSQGQAQFVNCDEFTVQFCLAMGRHTIRAVYSGDSSLSSSTSPPLTISVVKGIAPFASIFFFSTTGSLEIAVDFETGGLGIPPTGTLSFSDTVNGTTTTTLGSPVPLPLNPIVYRFFNLPSGSNVASATYSGDNNYLGSTSTSAPVTVQSSGLTPTQTTIMPQTSPIIEGQAVSFQVTVTSTQSSAVPTGNIFIVAGATILDNLSVLTLQNGSITVQTVMPNAAPTVQAFYFGDSNFAQSWSTAVPVSVAPLAAPLTITASAQNVSEGTQVSLIATVTPPNGTVTPQGTVQFFDSVNGGAAEPLGLTQLVLSSSNVGIQTGSAGIPAVLATGVHTITAAYSGDSNYMPIAQSDALTVTVAGASSALFAFSAGGGTTSATITSGQTATYNLFLNGNNFQGQVSLACSGAPAGMTCSANPATANLTANVTSVAITVTVGPSSAGARAAPANRLLWPSEAICVGIFAMFFLGPVGFGRKRKTSRRLRRAARLVPILLPILALLAVMMACSGVSSVATPPAPPAPQTYNLTLTGSNGSFASSIPLTLTVNPATTR